MTVSVVGCGASAKDWYKTPCDLSIGVNDVEKWGHPVDWLVVVNVPGKFRGERWDTIVNSKPKRFICHNGQWKRFFPQAELTPLHPFRGSVKPGKITHTISSPFVAMNFAYSAGATDIILWGVDFLNHPKIKDRKLGDEVSNYKRLFDALEEKGVNIWLGSPESVFRDYLKVWPVNIA